MIDKIKKWKIKTDASEFVLAMNTGLVKKVIYIKGKQDQDSLLGWNIYSVLRSLIQFSKKIEVYRVKDGIWVKINLEKLQIIINEVCNVR